MEKCRVKTGPMKSDATLGFCGAFFIPMQQTGRHLKVVSSDGGGWEHVSVSLHDRTPTWEEMCYIKDLFWNPSEAVMQLHPPETEYVNNMRYCLHLWRPTDATVPLPPQYMVGIKSLGVIG